MILYFDFSRFDILILPWFTRRYCCFGSNTHRKLMGYGALRPSIPKSERSIGIADILSITGFAAVFAFMTTDETRYNAV